VQLGQHLSTVQLVPLPWSQAMKPLQDQCFPTPLEALQELFLAETGAPMSYFFSSFDPEPIGVASLAQVHRAVDRESGREVAVKCMHPDIEECVLLFASSLPPPLCVQPLTLDYVQQVLGHRHAHDHVPPPPRQARLPRVRVYVARRGDGGEPAARDGLPCVPFSLSLSHTLLSDVELTCVRPDRSRGGERRSLRQGL